DGGLDVGPPAGCLDVSDLGVYPAVGADGLLYFFGLRGGGGDEDSRFAQLRYGGTVGILGHQAGQGLLPSQPGSPAEGVFGQGECAVLGEGDVLVGHPGGAQSGFESGPAFRGGEGGCADYLGVPLHTTADVGAALPEDGLIALSDHLAARCGSGDFHQDRLSPPDFRVGKRDSSLLVQQVVRLDALPLCEFDLGVDLLFVHTHALEVHAALDRGDAHLALGGAEQVLGLGAAAHLAVHSPTGDQVAAQIVVVLGKIEGDAVVAAVPGGEPGEVVGLSGQAVPGGDVVEAVADVQVSRGEAMLAQGLHVQGGARPELGVRRIDGAFADEGVDGLAGKAPVVGPVVPGQGEQVEVEDAMAVHDGRFVQDAQQVGRVGGGLRFSVVDDPPEKTAEGTFVPPCEKLFRVGCFDVEADVSPVPSPCPLFFYAAIPAVPGSWYLPSHAWSSS